MSVPEEIKISTRTLDTISDEKSEVCLYDYITIFCIDGEVNVSRITAEFLPLLRTAFSERWTNQRRGVQTGPKPPSIRVEYTKEEVITLVREVLPDIHEYFGFDLLQGEEEVKLPGLYLTSEGEVDFNRLQISFGEFFYYYVTHNTTDSIFDLDYNRIIEEKTFKTAREFGFFLRTRKIGVNMYTSVGFFPVVNGVEFHVEFRNNKTLITNLKTGEIKANPLVFSDLAQFSFIRNEPETIPLNYLKIFHDLLYGLDVRAESLGQPLESFKTCGLGRSASNPPPVLVRRVERSENFGFGPGTEDEEL